MTMDWTISLSLIIEIFTIACFAGMTYQSIVTLRRDVDKLEKEIVDFRELKSKLAVIETELKILNTNFLRFLSISKDEKD
jgi:hypothetical protein